MRISDWSSDVCSSDLFVAAQIGIKALPAIRRIGQRIIGETQQPIELERGADVGKLRIERAVTRGPGAERRKHQQLQFLGRPIIIQYLSDEGRGRDAVGGKDRKSTRLNSSH